MIYEYPLAWPVGVKRKGSQERSRFDTSEAKAKMLLEGELVRTRATNAIITTNVELRRDGRPYAGQKIPDNGVAVYFIRKGHDQVIACDKWDKIGDNILAIAKTIEALRGIERWGTGEMVDAAYTGFTAIPANASSGEPKRPWHEVLGVSPDAPIEVVEAAYKAMRRKTHPDVGGSEWQFNEVQTAYKEAIKRSPE